MFVKFISAQIAKTVELAKSVRSIRCGAVRWKLSVDGNPRQQITHVLWFSPVVSNED